MMGLRPRRGGHGGAVALGQHVEAVAGADDHHPVGLERRLDPFAQQWLGEGANAAGAVEPAELRHREGGQLPATGGGEPAGGAKLREGPQPHRPETGGEQRRRSPSPPILIITPTNWRAVLMPTAPSPSPRR